MTSRQAASPLRLTLTLTLLAACLAGAWLLGREAYAPFDPALMLGLHAHATPTLTTLMTVVTHSASSVVTVILVVAGAALLWVRGQRRNAVALVLGVALASLLGEGLKLLVQRPRPDLFPHLVHAGGWSYPSGHTRNAVVVYGLLAWLAGPQEAGWRRALVRAAALVWAGLVALSRVYLGVHYPSDVLASLLLGIPWVLGVVWLSAPKPRVRRQ